MSSAYPFAVFCADFLAALGNSRLGRYSGRYIGDPSKVGMWDRAKLAELYNGLLSAHNLFYFDIGVGFKDFAQVVMAECLQESTGNYNLWVGPVVFNDGDAHGVIQATPQSVILDYHVWGQSLIDASGTVVLRPADVLRWDLSHNTLNVLIWAWYTRNTLAAGLSLNEYGFRDQWHGVPHRGIDDAWINFGNAMYVWLGGPYNYRERAGSNQDYYLRVKDYYTHNFGSEAQFEAIFNVRVPKRTIALSDRMNVSSDEFKRVKVFQQQPPPGIRDYKPALGPRRVAYGTHQIGFHLPSGSQVFAPLSPADRVASPNRHDLFPFRLTDAEVQRYLERVYPAWNDARLKSLPRQADWQARVWWINGKQYTL